MSIASPCSMIILIGCGTVVVKLKPIYQATKEELLNGEAAAGLAIHGTISRGSGFGFLRNGSGRFGQPPGPGGIYQQRNAGYNQHGYIPGRKRTIYFVRMRTYRPSNPRTALQQANRSRFNDAVAAWRDMPPEERKKWNTVARKKSRIGRNFFISEYMLQS